jgi:hypothetical protein
VKRDHVPPVESGESFRATHWTIVMEAVQSQAQGGQSALAKLCRLYWYPLYVFARLSGHSPDDASALTQGFFLHLLEHRALTGVDRLKGKFRSFLLASLQDYLSHELDRARLKRGGNEGFVQLDAEDAEDRRTCSVCGTEFSANIEFCPGCMLRRGLNEPVESDEFSLEKASVESSSALQEHRFAHYELVKGEDGKPLELGHGAMGVTYKALDVNLRCAVALKVINARFIGDESAAGGLFGRPAPRPACVTRMWPRCFTSGKAGTATFTRWSSLRGSRSTRSFGGLVGWSRRLR